MTLKALFQDLVVDRRTLDLFLDPDEPCWAVFDPELGYRLRSGVVRDGVDGCWTISSYAATGERRMVHYADRSCRIATYGDSFTQCHQVSDGETWQETLAAHFGEPVRNYGIGGYGAFQALLRMRRHESGPDGCSHIVFNLFDDDHYRSIDRWRWIRIPGFRDEVKGTNPWYFHANPWSHLRLDPASGVFVERPSLCPTPESLYRLCDASFLEERLGDDVVVHCEQAKAGGEFDPKVLRTAADQLGLPIDLGDADRAAASAERLHTEYALSASRYVIGQARSFCEARGKRLWVVLSFGAGNIRRAVTGASRFDASFADWLSGTGLPTFDLWQVHAEDARQFSAGTDAYLRRYFIGGFGHYNPTGNHFFAFAMKDGLVRWLDPPPPTYREGGIRSAGMANLLA